MELTAALTHWTRREDLTADQTRAVFERLMDGTADPALFGALLAALAAKGECPEEIVGAARALRARVTPVQAPPGVAVLDTCGTGGDGQPLLNVSTCVAIVAAAAGATVAKHGNRSNARPSGSAEVLTSLGVNIEADVPVLERCLRECRIAFLYAPRLHPAMKHAAPIRRALGTRTIFNLIGPLTNPAGARHQLLGVNRPELVPVMLQALRELGAERAMVVHGSGGAAGPGSRMVGGICDLSIAGPSRVGWWDGHDFFIADIEPANILGRIGVSAVRDPLATLRVDSPDHSAAMIHDVLRGQPGPAREMIVLNAAAALRVVGLEDDWPAAAARARQVIDTGAARETLEQWVRCSQGSVLPGGSQ